MRFIRLVKAESIMYITNPIIKEAIITTTALFCSSGHVGHDTLFTNSLYASSKYNTTLFIVLSLAREERLELPTPGFGDQCSTN